MSIIIKISQSDLGTHIQHFKYFCSNFKVGFPVINYMYFMDSKTGDLTNYWPVFKITVAAQHWFISIINSPRLLWFCFLSLVSS